MICLDRLDEAVVLSELLKLLAELLLQLLALLLLLCFLITDGQPIFVVAVRFRRASPILVLFELRIWPQSIVFFVTAAAAVATTLR